MKTEERIAGWFVLSLVGLFLFTAFSWAFGCATGRGAAGEIILGVEVGRLVETTEQALIGAAGMIPGVGPFIQTLMLGVIGSGATVAGVSKMLMNRVEKRRKVADQEREEVRVELAVAETKIETMNGGS